MPRAPSRRSTSSRRSCATARACGRVDDVEIERVATEGHEQFATRGVSAGVFVVQQHAATARHFDLRLEVDGVMRSWAVPKGPSLDPAVKRFAVEVADHDTAHNTFEGTLDAGAVIVWDRGSYEQGGRVPWPEALTRGHAVFVLHGEKLRGGFALQRTRTGAKAQWLLIKRRDDSARPGSDVVAEQPALGAQRAHARGAARMRLGRALATELLGGVAHEAQHVVGLREAAAEALERLALELGDAARAVHRLQDPADDLAVAASSSGRRRSRPAGARTGVRGKPSDELWSYAASVAPARRTSVRQRQIVPSSLVSMRIEISSSGSTATGFWTGKNACAQLDFTDGGSLSSVTLGDSCEANQPHVPCRTPAFVTETVTVAAKSASADSSNFVLSRRAGAREKVLVRQMGHVDVVDLVVTQRREVDAVTVGGAVVQHRVDAVGLDRRRRAARRPRG